MKTKYILLFVFLFTSIVVFGQSGVLFDQKGISVGYEIKKLDSFKCVYDDGSNNGITWNWYQIFFWVNNRTNKDVRLGVVQFNIGYDDFGAQVCWENPDYDYSISSTGNLNGLGFNTPYFHIPILRANSSVQGSVIDNSSVYPTVGHNGIRFTFIEDNLSESTTTTATNNHDSARNSSNSIDYETYNRYVASGNRLKNLGDLAGAIEYYKQAITIDPSSKDLPGIIAFLEQKIAEKEKMEQAKKDEAENYRELKNKAQSAENIGNHQVALDYYLQMKQIIQGSPRQYPGVINSVNAKISELENKIRDEKNKLLTYPEEVQKTAYDKKLVYQAEQQQIKEEKQRKASFNQSIDDLKKKAAIASINGDHKTSLEYYKEIKRLNPNEPGIDILIQGQESFLESSSRVYNNGSNSYTQSGHTFNTAQEDAILAAAGTALVEGLTSLFTSNNTKSPKQLERERQERRERERIEKEQFIAKIGNLQKRALSGDNNALNDLLDDYNSYNASRYGFAYKRNVREDLVQLSIDNPSDLMLRAKGYLLKAKENNSLKTTDKMDLLFTSINSYKKGGYKSFNNTSYGYDDPIENLRKFSLQEDYEKFVSNYDNNLSLVDLTGNVISKRYQEYASIPKSQLIDMHKAAKKKHKRIKRLPLKILVAGLIAGAATYAIGSSQKSKGEEQLSVDKYNDGLFLEDTGRNIAIGSALGAGISIPLKRNKQRALKKKEEYIGLILKDN
ncbi:tetratricopeptide repeat protein [Ulvibacterium sp.]|uniref:tetratricopeptide repeat protein n=1 Tax=Ulvibacterium sp. TaxID=2665914 RepID=UPI003BA93526